MFIAHDGLNVSEETNRRLLGILLDTVAHVSDAVLYRVFRKMGTEPKMRTKRYLQNHVVYQRTKMILRNPLASPVRGARQNGHAPSHASGWAQKAIYAGPMVISLDAGYRGDAEDFQPERQLIRRLLYSPTGLSFFFFLVLHDWFAF